MRWFRKHGDSPRLLSLFPLRNDATTGTQEDDIVEATNTTTTDALAYQSQSRIDMTPTTSAWLRRRSTGSSSDDTHIYNVTEGVVIVERSKCRQQKNKHLDATPGRELRKPLLDRVKHTRLSCFRSLAPSITASDSTKNNCHDLDLCADVDVQPCMKNSSKQSDSSSLDGRLEETHHKSVMFDVDTVDCSKTSPKIKRKSRKAIDRNDLSNASCFSAKLKAMSEKYLHSSTNRFLAKLYKHNSDGNTAEASDSVNKNKKSKAKLRSFSYGALPGLEEFQKKHNPLYHEEDTINPFKDEDELSQQALLIDTEDCDSGILVNESATSSVLDSEHSPFRCDSAASSSYSPINMSGNENRNTSFLYSHLPTAWNTSENGHQKMDQTKEEYDKNHRVRSLDRREIIRRVPNVAKSDEAISPPPIRTTRIPNEVKLVRIYRTNPAEELGVFIAKKSLPGHCGYVVAHIVPGSLAESEGTLCVGDEVMNINGRRLAGLSLEEAHAVLRCTTSELDLVIARPVEPKRAQTSPSSVSGVVRGTMRESSVDYENAYVFPYAENVSRVSYEKESSCYDEVKVDHNRNDVSKKRNHHFQKNVTSNSSSKILKRTAYGSTSPAKEASNENLLHSRHSMPASTVESDFNKHRCKKLESQQDTDLKNSGNYLTSTTNFCTLPRRPRSTVCTFHTIIFEKGPGKKSLGFTIVGGRDSPKGALGIFIKSILPGGQASEDGRLRAGDEVLAVNGHVCHDISHSEAVQLFKSIKSGPIALHLCRRIKSKNSSTKAKSCLDLLQSSNTR